MAALQRTSQQYVCVLLAQTLCQTLDFTPCIFRIYLLVLVLNVQACLAIVDKYQISFRGEKWQQVIITVEVKISTDAQLLGA